MNGADGTFGQVAEITEPVKELADQSKVLALNAAAQELRKATSQVAQILGSFRVGAAHLSQ